MLLRHQKKHHLVSGKLGLTYNENKNLVETTHACEQPDAVQKKACIAAKASVSKRVGRLLQKVAPSPTVVIYGSSPAVLRAAAVG